jgi:hypothetical protein
VKKNRGIIWIIFLFFIILSRYWHLVTPNKELREYILRDFIQNGQETAFLSALKRGSFLLWDITTGGGTVINNGMSVFYPLNLLYLFFVRNDFIVHHVFQYMLVLHTFLMGAFTYLLLRELQASRPASFISGLIYSFNGYTLVHSMQLGLINTMTWLPLIFFFLERSRREKRMMPALWGGVALGIGTLAGHAQIYFYMALSVSLYAIFWTITGWSKAPSWKEIVQPLAYLIVLGTVAFGVSAIQTIPAYSIGVTSEHATADEYFKLLNPLKFYQLFMLIIPWGLDAVSDWNILVSERYAYMGWVTLLFGLAVFVWRKEAKIYAYATIAAISLILAMGENSILFNFFYNYIPGYNMFRYPSRVLILFVFGMAVLTGLGLDYYLSDSESDSSKKKLPRMLKLLAIGGLAIWVVGIGSLTVTSEMAIHKPLIHLVSQFTYVLFVVWIWWVISKIRESHPVKSGLIAVIVALVLFDLWSQGSIHALGRVPSPDRLSPEEKTAVIFLNEKKKENEIFRIENHSLRESLLPRHGISAYNTWNRLMIKDYLDLMHAVNENPRIMDLLNVRYIVGSRGENQLNISTLYGDLNLIPTGPRIKVFNFKDKPLQTNRIEIISFLKFAAHIPQGEKVAEIILWDKKEKLFKLPIRAGIETAEWALDRPNLKGEHRKIEVAKSWEAPEKGYFGHHYRGLLTLYKSIELIGVELRYTRSDGQLEISQMKIDGKDINILTERFKDVAPEILLNRYALQRAFLVPEAKVITNKEELLKEIKWFDPEQVVLLSKSASSMPKQEDSKIREEKPLTKRGSAKILSYSPWKILIEVDTPITQYLVLSDTYHPWWRAKIDGKRTEVLKANLALRALIIPEGRHEVEFYLVPISFYWGAGITFTTLIGVGIMAFFTRRKQDF